MVSQGWVFPCSGLLGSVSGFQAVRSQADFKLEL